MTNRWGRVPVFPLLMVPLTLGITAVETSTTHIENTEAFAEAELFLELNDTAGDLGIHSSIDGGPWTELEIQGPIGRAMLEITSTGRLQSHGLTQLFFESAEPSFDELDPADFFRRFPEGPYTIEGRLMEGGTLESTGALACARRPARQRPRERSSRSGKL